MSLLDQHFEEALRDLPEKKLSFFADFRIKRLLKKRAHELEGGSPFWYAIRRFAAVPLGLVLFFSATSTYAFYSPAVVKGNFLYPVKTTVENALYPHEGSTEKRIAFHLWLNERRLDEAGYVEGSETRDQTVQEANKNVELAILISREIPNQEALSAITNEISTALQRSRNSYERFAPRLIGHHQILLNNLTTTAFQHPPFVPELPEHITVEQEPKKERLIEKALRTHYQEHRKILKLQMEQLGNALNAVDQIAPLTVPIPQITVGGEVRPPALSQPQQRREEKTRQKEKLIASELDVKQSEASAPAVPQVPESLLLAIPENPLPEDPCQLKAKEACAASSESDCEEQVASECQSERTRKEEQRLQLQRKEEKLREVERKLNEFFPHDNGKEGPSMQINF